MLNKIFNLNNFLITVRAMVTGVILMIISWLIALLFLIIPILGIVLMLFWFILSLFLWGFIFNMLPIGKVD